MFRTELEDRKGGFCLLQQQFGYGDAAARRRDGSSTALRARDLIEFSLAKQSLAVIAMRIFPEAGVKKGDVQKSTRV